MYNAMFKALLWCLVVTGLSACGATFYGEPREVPKEARVRFLLTFDDGPSGKTRNNPTLRVMQSLQYNPLQKNIKAVFFIQSRDPRLGGSPRGQRIMQQQFRQGHLLAVHTGTRRHVSHIKLLRRDLGQTLQNCRDDIRKITGQYPQLVRPPYLAYNAQTLEQYRDQKLLVLLTDVRAFDGKIKGFNMSLRRRSSMRKQLTIVKQRIAESRLPAVDGVIPVIVTFHDINSFTARHMTEYLHILVEESKRVGLPLSSPVFYGDSEKLQRAALSRGRHYMQDIPLALQNQSATNR